MIQSIFTLKVPAGPQKKELMEHLDQLPTYVQSLQYIVKNATVGKAATFTKVDNVIQETKNLMTIVSKLVTICFSCATKVSSFIFLTLFFTIICNSQLM